MLPLSDLRVLDFTALLPGPLCTLVLAEAGASVIKVERPGSGEAGRQSYTEASKEPVDFALLNKGKKSVVLDLKSDSGREAAQALAARADVLVEQFRPGVMARLGLGYEQLSKTNPRLIYCSISGFGQTGPLVNKVGHDLNYIARTGLLGLATEADGRPAYPQGHYADIGGGTYPALVNIMLAMLQREKTGRGQHLDIAMAENTFFWMRRALSPVLQGIAPDKSKRLPSTGDSPRYGIYLAADSVAISVAPLEEQFWKRFCDILGLSEAERQDRKEPAKVRALIQSKLAEKTGAEWDAIFAGEEVCVEIARDARDAMDDPQFVARGVFERKLRLRSGKEIPALPLPIQKSFVSPETTTYPAAGENDGEISSIWP
ncbi:CoA transferase [Chelativorans sp. AA-79]|uniref:CaiB/BaiF CoA transferase family protein n=1 Tax=Chelativorans sp. AA-79 TaxID=3028735 RepID=UPI0023F84E8A|nr:CoA transferase [Chelativorans sp. AA-79]WEX12449.1 CoA transferase [Chelativorans sp. AA-79]